MSCIWMYMDVYGFSVFWIYLIVWCDVILQCMTYILTCLGVCDIDDPKCAASHTWFWTRRNVEKRARGSNWSCHWHPYPAVPADFAETHVTQLLSLNSLRSCPVLPFERISCAEPEIFRMRDCSGLCSLYLQTSLWHQKFHWVLELPTHCRILGEPERMWRVCPAHLLPDVLCFCHMSRVS